MDFLGFCRIPRAPRAPWATFGDLLWCSWAAFGELWSDLWSPEARKLACGLHFVQVCEKYTVRVFKNRLGRPSGDLFDVASFFFPWFEKLARNAGHRLLFPCLSIFLSLTFLVQRFINLQTFDGERQSKLVFIFLISCFHG